jgi:hypothetical protein
MLVVTSHTSQSLQVLKGIHHSHCRFRKKYITVTTSILGNVLGTSSGLESATHTPMGGGGGGGGEGKSEGGEERITKFAAANSAAAKPPSLLQENRKVCCSVTYKHIG